MTHINAYFAEVAEKEQAVLDAHAAWEDAKKRLELKKREDGYVEAEAETPEVSEDQASETETDPRMKSRKK